MQAQTQGCPARGTERAGGAEPTSSAELTMWAPMGGSGPGPKPPSSEADEATGQSEEAYLYSLRAVYNRALSLLHSSAVVGDSDWLASKVSLENLAAKLSDTLADGSLALRSNLVQQECKRLSFLASWRIYKTNLESYTFFTTLRSLKLAECADARDSRPLAQLISAALLSSDAETTKSDLIAALEVIRTLQSTDDRGVARALISGLLPLAVEKEPEVEESGEVLHALTGLLLISSSSLGSSKFVSEVFSLLARLFERFSILRVVPVSLETLRLSQRNHFVSGHLGAAVHLHTLFMHRFEESDLENLVEILVHKNGWERLHVVFSTTLRLKNSDSIGFSGISLPFVLATAERLVRQMMNRPDTLALQTAISLAKKLDLSGLVLDAKARLSAHRINHLVSRGKWRLAGQLCSSVPQFIDLFNQLKSEGRFVEAQSLYEENRLEFSQSGIEPVDLKCIEAQDSKARETFLQLPSSVKIFVVDNMSSLSLVAESLLIENEFRFVGVDSEWVAGDMRNNADTDSETGASILQMATASRIYIFDLETLALSDETLSYSTEILTAIFYSQSFVKLGWSFGTDISMLQRASRSSFARVFDAQRIQTVVDLNKVMVSIYARQSSLRPSFSKIKACSLSDTCRLIFNRPLEKTMQCSDWGRRPLSRRQVNYAALDAHALLGVWDFVVCDVAARNGHVACPALSEGCNYHSHLAPLSRRDGLQVAETGFESWLIGLIHAQH